MVLAALIKYFLCLLNKKTTPFFSTAGPIENCALCPSRYIEIILYADEGSFIDLPPLIILLSEMQSRAGKKIAVPIGLIIKSY